MEPLKVSGTLDSLSAIASYVMAAAAAAGLEKKIAYKLRLAVDEIATNIIIHGYEEANREGELALEANIDRHALTLSMEDTGIPYDPHRSEAIEEAEFKLPLEQRKMGGLGVYLAIQGVDKFMYERVGERNRNIFVVNLPNTGG